MEHGVSINPIAFLVVQQDGVRLLPVNYTSSVEKLLDYIPDVIDKANDVVNKMLNKKQGNSCEQPQKPKMEKRKEIVPQIPEEKPIKQRTKRTKTSNNKIQPNNTSLEYEYDETMQESLGDISDYTNYSDEYDD